MRIGDRIGSATIAAIAGERPPSAPSTYTMTIIGWRPRSLNELMKVHYMIAYRLKKRDKARIAVEKIVQRIPDAVHKRRVSLRIVLHGRDQVMDGDNVWKSCLDALVACRALVNDTPEWVDLGSVDYDRGKRATVITLTDLVD